jgi:hypothetical protein
MNAAEPNHKSGSSPLDPKITERYALPIESNGTEVPISSSHSGAAVSGIIVPLSAD